MKRQGADRFTILELLIVFCVIVILAAMLMPILTIARSKARYARWLGYKNGLRTHSNLVAMYDFEEEGDTLLNTAVGPDAITNYVPEALNIPITKPEWTDGRWHTKKALQFAKKTYAEVTDLPTALPAVDAELTLIWWTYADSVTGKQVAVDMRPNGPGSIQCGLRNQKLTVRRSNNTVLVQAGDRADSDRWTQGAYTLTPNGEAFTNDLYVNGDLVATTGTLPETGRCNRLYVGRSGDGSERFKGRMDQLLVFNKVLAPQEIRNDFVMGDPR